MGTLPFTGCVQRHPSMSRTAFHALSSPAGTPTFRGLHAGIKRATAAGVVALVCALAPAAVQAQQDLPIRIGLVGPMSGGSADFGQSMVNGAQLAINEINAVGGYLGRKIELVVKNDQGDPPVGGRVAEELVGKDKVVAAIGYCNTGVALAGIPVFQKAGVPLIVPCATGSPILTQAPMPQNMIFQTSPRDALQAPFVVGDAFAKGARKFAVLADTTPYGEAGLADVLKALKARDLTPVYVGHFPLGLTPGDAENMLSKARDAGADVLLTYTVGPENGSIALARKALKWSVPLTGPWPLSFPNFIQKAGATAEGTTMVQDFIAEPTTPRRTAFLLAYERAYKTRRIPVPMAAAQAYDSVYLLMYAILQTPPDKPITSGGIKTALENLDRIYYGVVTNYDRPFNQRDHAAITANMLVMGEVRDGKVGFANASDAKKAVVIETKK